MAGKHDGFQLLEFQPKTVYLPENNGTTGTFRRPGSAEGHGEAEYARIPRRSYNEYDGTGPRERFIPLHETNPVDNIKQPLLNHNGAPVYLLVPADGANLAASQGRYVGGNGAGVVMMDGHGIRRRPTYVHERVDVDSYRREKSCCSCWKCMIALIVILTIIGLGLAITGIVFIKLIHQDSQSTIVNGTTEVRSIPSQRSAMSDPGSPSFDLTGDSPKLADNGTANASLDIVDGSGFRVNLTSPGLAANITRPTNMSDTVNVLQVALSGNATTVVKIETGGPQEAKAADPEVDPLVASVYGVYNEEAYRQDPDEVHPLVARVFNKGNYGFNDTDYEDELNSTTSAPVIAFTGSMAIAFHHTDNPIPVPHPIIQNLTQQGIRVIENAQRTIEEASRESFRAAEFVRMIHNASGEATTTIPATLP